MFKITRVAGDAPGRSGGTAYNGFAWAVGVSPDKSADMYLQSKQALVEIDRILAEMGTGKTALINDGRGKIILWNRYELSFTA